MDEKLRPGYEVMQQQQTAVGVSPNPAANLSWPMSYSSTVPPSFERAGATPVPVVDNNVTAGTRYDPIRQDQDIQPDLDNDSDQEQQTKRKKLDSKPQPGVDGKIDYSYQPQKIVIPTNSLQSGKRSHVCDLCGATFTRQHNLKSHFLTHTSSKKEFICSECGSEFRRSHDLKRHQKLHTGEKPFACQTCGRRFARADALGRHTKSTGDAGCVNSRRATSDNGSAGDAQLQLISPTDSAGRASMRRGSELGISDERSPHLPDFETQNLPNVGQTDPSLAQDQYTFRELKSDGHGASARSALPPLRAAFPFDHAQSFAESSNAREILPSPPFGLPAAFEPRSSSAHPLSYDRGSTQDQSSTAQSSTQANSSPAMVPLQRFRQLEAEHHAAMERIRHFEGDGEPIQ